MAIGPDLRHNVYSINKLREYHDLSKSASWYKEGEFWDFCIRVWESSQGTIVPIPKWMTTYTANDLTSIICVEKQKRMNLGGEVNIKKVAEIRGSRFNSGKARMDLLDPDAMEGIAAVLAFGANKYADHNWRKGLPFMETIASMLRHIWKFVRGEDLDEETGLPHVDHIGCNAMFLAWMWRNRKDMDDRWKPVVDNVVQE